MNPDKINNVKKEEKEAQEIKPENSRITPDPDCAADSDESQGQGAGAVSMGDGSLASEVNRLNCELEELRGDSIRRLAEFENYKKNLDREKEEFLRHANQKLILQLLDVVDNMERAITQAEKKDAETAAGIGMIYRQLMKVFGDSGVRPIESLGRKFDPYRHEAFLQRESEEPEGTVIEELQKGYMLHEKVLRHSKVVVAKPCAKDGLNGVNTGGCQC